MTAPLTTAIDRLFESKGPATRWLESNSEIIRKWIEEDKLAEEWIEWNGGICPVPLDTTIEYRLRHFRPDQEPFRCLAGFCRWDHGRTPDSEPALRANDIIAYRVVQP